MILVYNILQLLLAPLLILLLPIYLTRKPGKRVNLKARLGFGLKPMKEKRDHAPTIWIHALSVGEVTSAQPLVQALRSELPQSTIVFSATTSSGQDLAPLLIGQTVDQLVPFPLDILPVVNRFLNVIQPDLFILVETDFWPNFLNACAARNIKTLLVNGRISKRSMRSYLRYDYFFRPIFDRFALLCMQTAHDSQNMQRLGIPPTKLKTLGNLKFAAPGRISKESSPDGLMKQPGRLYITCGSTHDGEEDLLVSSYAELREAGHDLHLIIAPRQVERSKVLLDFVRERGFSAERYSVSDKAETDITILDTLGDLTAIYASSDITFIGGSMVPEGGHNPLEAARHGNPLLFGPCMDDFSEISGALLESDAAFEVTDQASLSKHLEMLIVSEGLRHRTGQRARAFTEQQQHVLPAHIAVIKDLI